MKKFTFLVLFACLLFTGGYSQQAQMYNLTDGDTHASQLNILTPVQNGGQSQIGTNHSPSMMTTWVLPSTNSTSGNSRIPRNAGVRYQREELLILPSEMAASGFPSGATIDALGFLISTAGVGTQTGQLNIYLMNTSDVTYTLGNTWTTTGFTQVSSDAAFTVPINAGAYSIPFVNGSSFTYTGGGVYVAWEFSNPAGAMGTTALIAYCNTTQATLCYGYQSAAAQGTTLAVTAFRPAMTFTNNALTDIAAVTNIYTTERTPLPFGSPTPVDVRILNNSASPLSCNVTLTVKDIATSTTRYTATLPLTSLPAGTSGIVSFPGWSPVLQENVNVTATTSVIAGETFTNNNTLTIPVSLNSSVYGYIYNLTGIGGYGYTYPGTGIFAAKYYMNGTGSVKGANIFIYNYATNPGNTVNAVVMNSSGTILSQSPDYVLQASDLGTNVSFTFPAAQSFTNEAFYVGLIQTPGTAQWYPLGTVTEAPARGNTFFTAAATGGTLTADAANLKYAIEAVIVPYATVVTSAATAVNSAGATLNGTVNANNLSTTASFQYGLTTAYGSTIAAVPGTVTGTTTTSISASLTGLSTTTLYHYRAVGVNSTGTAYGQDMTFTTVLTPPVVTTTSATGIGATTATVNGTVNANGSSSTVTFQYGLTTAYGTNVNATPGTVTGTTVTPVLANLSGLVVNNTYHYRCVAVNAGGTTYGNDAIFTTGCTAPVISVTGPVTACAGSTGNVYTTETGMNNYSWTVNGGTITSGSGTNSVTVTWNTAGPQSISVNYTNGGGCSALTPFVYNVTVNTSPVPVITGATSLCVNSGYYTYSTAAGMSNYTWTISSGNIINAGQGTNQVMVTWSAAGAQTITVNYANAGGCMAGSPTVLNVTVNSVPSGAGSISGQTSICGGSGIAYSVAPIANTVYYVWSLPSSATIASGAGTNNITVDFTGNVTGPITVYGNNLCGNGTVSPAINVNYSALPETAGAITGETAICEGATDVAYSVPVISYATSYHWSVPSGATVTSGGSTNSITVSYPSPVTGNVTVYGSNTCGNGTASTLPVTVSATPPAPVISVAGSIISSNASSGNQWYKDGNILAGMTSATIDASLYGSGWYWDVVTLNSCSSDSSNNLYVLIEGIEDHGMGFSIYPVPADGRFNIIANGKITGSCSISVISQTGITVYSGSTEIKAGQVIPVDIRPVSDGIYTILLNNGKTVISRKIIITR